MRRFHRRKDIRNKKSHVDALRYKYGDVSSSVFTNKSLCASLPRMAVSASDAVDKDEISSKAKKEEPNLIYADLFWNSLGIL
jgi:hypothetical protein